LTRHRIIPAALASVGFLLTFTIRSWHEDLWRPGQTADYEIASTPQPLATARGASIAVPPLESVRPLESVLREEAARLRAAQTSAAPSAVASADAQHYLAERGREESHNGRMR
jgi:hypothetical protein